MTRPTGPFARALPLGLIAAAMVVVATTSCTEINSAAGHVAGLEFDTLPAPSVVAGDTLRDSLGRAAPLRALAFGASGDLITNTAIQYITLDTGITIGAGGFVTAQRRSGTVKILASAGSLQTQGRSLIIARRPDSAIATGKLRDSLFYVTPDNATTNTAAALTVKVATNDTTGGIATTQGWLVSYQAFFRGNAIAPGDTSVVFLLGDGVQRSGLDTTGSDGTASRRVRVRPIGITQAPNDSVVVLATVRHLGAHIRGSPLRFVIFLRPKLGAAR